MWKCRSQLNANVDMTSVVKYVWVLAEAFLNQPALVGVLVRVNEDARVSADAGPVTSTVDPAEIRGLGTT